MPGAQPRALSGVWPAGNVEHYADPRNSFLDEVLARRTGIPLSLCTVYLLVAQRIGLSLEPVGLPGHFLLGCYVEGAPFFIDAFDQGAFRTGEEIFAALRASHIAPRVTDLAPTRCAKCSAVPAAIL